MNLARWTTAAAVFAAFWCAGAFGLLPRMQEKLAQAAQTALQQQNTLQGRLDRVQVLFEGQTARLTGKVRSAQDRLVVGSTVENLVRAPSNIAPSVGRDLNPVAAVRNDIEVAPFPPGWLLLTTHGDKARLIGTAATDLEGRDLVNAVVESWSAHGGQAAGRLGADLEHHDEATNVAATLASIPAPPPDAPHRVEAHLARIGGKFETLKLTQDEAALHDVVARLGIREEEWSAQLQPLLRTLRAEHTAAQEREKESARVAALPLGHLFVAVRDQRVVISGAVGSGVIKRAILDEALQVFGTRRVHDDIRVDATRRPVADFPPITTALLPAADSDATKAFHLGISGQAWQPLDWSGARDDETWKEPLPEGLDPALLRADSARLVDWLQGGTDPMPPMARIQPAFIVLAVFGKKALLSGQIAEPALHEQLIAAARQAYTPGIVVDAEAFVVRGQCEPSEEILGLAKSLPPLAEAPLLAIARPGGSWLVIPATREALEPGALTRSRRLPAELPANLVEEAAADALEELRFHLQSATKSATPNN